MINDSTNQKERHWTYIIFFLIGILSLPISQFLGTGLLGNPGIGTMLENLGILELMRFLQLFFPLVVCSILSAVGLYSFNNRSVIFVLKAFAVSLAVSSLINLIGLSVGGNTGGVIFSFLIISAIGLIAFKKRLHFTIKAFVISFAALYLTIVVLMVGSPGAGTLFIIIEKVDIQAGERVRYTEITMEELEKCPPLKEAVNSYNDNKYDYKVDTKDKAIVTDFFEKKRLASRYLFSIADGKSEENLNKGILSQELKNVFKTNGFSLSENASINQVNEIRWTVWENQYGLTYEILKEDEGLKVYDGKNYLAEYFKIGKTYYKMYIMHED